VAEIQGKVIKKGKRNAFFQFLHAKNDKEAIAIWRQDLNTVLHVFNVRPAVGVSVLQLAYMTDLVQTKLAINTNILVSNIHRSKANQEGTDGHGQPVSTASYLSATRHL
jgi:hypothetical protein